MTLQPAAPAGLAPKGAGAAGYIRLPDPPPDEMTAFYAVNFPGYPVSMYRHYGHRETTIITSEVAAALLPTASREGVRFPDLLVAFNVDPAAHRARNGYLIPEQGKPPDFVMEVASPSTASRDEGLKRENYAEMGIPEYWRFDETGGNLYATALAGDRLINGEYHPIPIHRAPNGDHWGRSPVLGLDLCWQNGQLRFWDPIGHRYLTTHDEMHDLTQASEAARQDAEARLNLEHAAWAEAEAARAEAEAQLDQEHAARLEAETARADAEARIRQLEEELRRRDP